jgi:hypothetical protein
MYNINNFLRNIKKLLQKDNFLQESSVIVEPRTSVSQASVESVMRAIRQRLKARIALCRQVQALGKICCNCIIFIYLILPTSA